MQGLIMINKKGNHIEAKYNAKVKMNKLLSLTENKSLISK